MTTNCPICNGPSQSVAAIRARETVTGSWSGSGGGLSVGADSIGLMAGGASGSTKSMTERAKAFVPPLARASDGVTKAILLVSGGVALMFFAYLGTSILGNINDLQEGITYYGTEGYVGRGGSVSQLAHRLDGFESYAGFVVIFAALCSLYSSISNSRSEEGRKAYLRAKRLDRERVRVYQQLRYCEADHVAFDPVSGKSAPAEAASVQRLIDSVASDVVGKRAP
ncbi:TPA: hypothetical protein NNM78_002213 [Pseudomonas aeruginosa]|nr:hypothetical protein [Pseudomonas aeruginosa]